MIAPEWEKSAVLALDILSVLQETNNDDDEYGSVEEVNCNKWEDETKPEGVHDDPAAVKSEKEKCYHTAIVGEACILYSSSS